jgi:hypothetical protein
MFCGQVKEYLSQKQIQFDDRDITKDPSFDFGATEARLHD